MYKLPEHKNRKEIPEYHIWKAMRARCSKTCNSNLTYKEKNITVCEEWNDFIVFYNDMGPRPSDKHSIDREDNNGNYCKSNCRWVIQKTQCENRGEFNKIFTYNGESKVLKEWARFFKIDYSVLHKRITYQKLSFEEAINYKGPGVREYNGEFKTLQEWADQYGISKGNLSSRLSRGKTMHEALKTPEKNKKI